MERLSVRIRNPFALKESLQVALEVAWPDMAPDRVATLRRFLRGVPSVVQPTALAIEPGTREGILCCAAYFRQSRAWYWLREDLCQAIMDLERELKTT